MTLVVDASIAFKWFAREPDTSIANALLRRGEALIAPEHLVAEVCNAAWKSWSRGEMVKDQTSAVAPRIRPLLAQLLSLDPLAPRALLISLDLNHPVYDCFYLALAERERTIVVTADGRLAGRVKGTPYAALVRHLSTYPEA